MLFEGNQFVSIMEIVNKSDFVVVQVGDVDKPPDGLFMFSSFLFGLIGEVA